MSVSAPRGLASSGQRAITEITHPLSAAEEPLSLPVSAGGDKEAWLTNGTPGEMSSPASTSSLFNRLQLDDDLEDGRDPLATTDTRDLFVTVDDPKKHVSTMETYITYRVSTKTTRIEFDLPQYSVRRRYQDFDWLRIKLEDSQPTHLVPPLPEKFVMKGVVDRFSEDFVETRMKALPNCVCVQSFKPSRGTSFSFIGAGGAAGGVLVAAGGAEVFVVGAEELAASGLGELPEASVGGCQTRSQVSSKPHTSPWVCSSSPGRSGSPSSSPTGKQISGSRHPRGLGGPSGQGCALDLSF